MAQWRRQPLLAFAPTQLDVFVKIDSNLEIQYNLKKLKLGIFVIRVPSKDAASRVRAGQVIHVISFDLAD